jgi:glutamine amidotransferase-like uncharacterized protein
MKPTMAIFIHHPECSQDCADGMVTALSPDFEIRMFDERELNAGRFDDIDIVAFGGGIGDADRYYDFFKRREGNTIADFVSRGGKYLGICMGAYWAGRNYFDLLDRLEPVQFIKRPQASVRRSYGTVAEVDWQSKKEMMFFYDGCTFVGDGRCQIVSRYNNQDPMAVIQGRVGLIGCHPESEKKWFDDLKYISKHWHEGRHHELLRSFAKKLLRQK